MIRERWEMNEEALCRMKFLDFNSKIIRKFEDGILLMTDADCCLCDVGEDVMETVRVVERERVSFIGIPCHTSVFVLRRDIKHVVCLRGRRGLGNGV